ncbi:MAG TPA: hypothetical protein VMW58_14130 [Anaerolineae bacterium]|nr:hypothetical protein [Anaerolineae bacterium]
MPEIKRREIWQVIGMSTLVLAISMVPYLLGYLAAGPKLEFGGFLINLDDSYSYVSAMQQGIAGGWRYQVLYTPEDHPGAYLHTFYMLLGKLSVPMGFSPMQMYHACRLCCGLVMLLAAYLFLSLFLQNPRLRLTAFSLICFSSGLGWLVLLTGSTTLRGLSPLDFWLTDAYVFFTLFAFPHFAAAVALLLLFLSGVVRYVEKPRFRILILGAAALVGLCVIHPFTVLLVDGILAAYWVLLYLGRKAVPRLEAAAFVAWALAPMPVVIYYFSAFLGDPVLANWSAQNILRSPPLTNLLLGYGILAALAAGGVFRAFQQWNERRILLLAWLVAAVILLYVPFTLQRRMVEGLHVPICILATIGLYECLVPSVRRLGWASRFARRRGYTSEGLRSLLVFSVVVATFPSNLCLVAGGSASVLLHDPDLFHRREEVEAIEWLGQNTASEDTVLASYEVGRYLPARIGHRVFMGHIHETVQLSEKIRLADSFFSEDTTDRDRRRLLSEYRIRYVLYGPSEMEMGRFDPSLAPYLTPMYSNDLVAVYNVQL